MGTIMVKKQTFTKIKQSVNGIAPLQYGLLVILSQLTTKGIVLQLGINWELKIPMDFRTPRKGSSTVNLCHLRLKNPFKILSLTFICYTLIRKSLCER